jgi:phosphoribosylformylglycinamidine (FGAM) synthase PurS component
MEIRVRPRLGLPGAGGKAGREAGGSAGQEAVRVGTAIYIDLDAPSAQAAIDAAQAMCRRILADPILEDFDIFPAGEEIGAAP